MSNHNATRKRRSSILKSKPRAPLAELEFNPPTPEVTSKSRRVSFSRKTGVAEFVMNEATTTWKNFYEEQNRTLESSGNDSEIHKPSTNRSVHQPFHEVEAEIDHTTLRNLRITPGANLTLFNDMNFTEQLANLDCLVGDNTVHVPAKKSETSVIGQTSNIFTNSFQNPIITEHTGRIEGDFSMRQSAQQNQEDLEDDLADIAKDVERSNPNMVGRNMFMNEFNQSCYVEVDLNETKGILLNDISDMSITDIIQSPNVQLPPKKSKQIGLDWAMDKENIVVDSFPTSVTENIVRSEEILVFDGKKLKRANINDKLDDILNEPLAERKTLNRPKSGKFDSTTLSQISADVLRCESNDIGTENVSKVNMNLSQDTKTHKHSIHKSMSHQMSIMPDMSLTDNYIENPSINITNKGLGISMMENSCNTNLTMGFEITQENFGSDVRNKPKLIRQKKTYSEYPSDKMSILSNTELQTKNTSILCQDKPGECTKRKTIILNQDDDLPNFTLDIPPQFDQRALKGFQENVVFDTEDSVVSMSTTQAILREIEETSGMFHNTIPSKPSVCQEKRQTIVFDTQHENGNMSVTQALPAIPVVQSKRQTIVFDKENNAANMSITQAIQSKSAVIEEKRQTINFDTHNENPNMSVTQAIPAIPVVQSKRQTIVFDKENDDANMSITQAIPSKSAVIQEKRQTIIFDTHNEDANMSVTQAIPAIPKVQLKRQTIVFDKENDNANMSITQAIPSKSSVMQEKRQTIIFDTQNEDANMSVTQAIPAIPIVQSKRQTIVFDKENVDANMSIMQAIPSKSAVIQEKRQTIIFDTPNEDANMSVTQAIPAIPVVQSKRQTIVFDKENVDANMSITQAIPSKSAVMQEKHQTIIFDTHNEDVNMSVTQAIPAIPVVQSKRQTIVFDKENVDANMSITQAIPSKSAVIQEKRQTIIFDTQNEDANMSVTQAIPAIPMVQSKRQTIVFDKENVDANMSIMQAIPSKSAVIQEKRQTIIFDTPNEDANMPVTQAIPAIPKVQPKRQTIVFDKENDNGNMSITQAISSKSAVMQEKRQTIIFDTHNEDANMSVTQAIPAIPVVQSKRQTIVFDKENVDANMSITQAIPSKSAVMQEKHQTIIFDTHNEDANMSVTQAIPAIPVVQSKRQTIVFDKENVDANMSITQAIPSKSAVIQEKRQTIIFDTHNENANMSVTQAIPAIPKVQPKCQTIVFDKENDNANMSITQAIPSKSAVTQEKRQTIIFDMQNEDANMSVTQAIPAIPIVQSKRQTIVFDKENDNANMSITQAITSKSAMTQEKHQTIIFDTHNVDANMSVTQAIPPKPSIVQQKRQTILIENANISVTQAVTSVDNRTVENKREIVSNKEMDENNMSVTQAVSTKSHNVSGKENYNAKMLLNKPVQKETADSNKKRKTTGFEHHDDLDDISLTQAVASAKSVSNEQWRATLFEKMSEIPIVPVPIQNKQSPLLENDLLITQGAVKIATEEKDNIFYGTEEGQKSKMPDKSIHMADQSIIQPMPQIIGNEKKLKTANKNYLTNNTSTDDMLPHSTVSEEKRETILYHKFGDESKPCLIVNEEKRKTIIFDKNDVSVDSLLNEGKAHMIVSEEKRKTIVFGTDTDSNHTVTQSLSKNVLSEEPTKSVHENDNSVRKEVLKMSETRDNLECDINTSKHHKIDSSILNNQELQQSIFRQKQNTSENLISEYELEKSTATENKELLSRSVKDTIACCDEITNNDKVERTSEDGNDLTKHIQSTNIINPNTLNLVKKTCVTQSKNDSVKNQSQLVTKKHEILQELDDTNDIIDMLTNATDQIEQNQLESARKGEPTHKQKIMTEESLERMITDLEKNQNDIEVNVEPQEKKESIQIEGNIRKTKHNGVKTKLTIPYLLNQTERIKSLNITIDKRPSWDNIMQDDFKNCKTKIEKPQTRISIEVVKTLNFEEDSFDRPEQVNISGTRNNDEKLNSTKQEHLTKDVENISTAKDFSITNFDPPMCSTQRFSIKSSDLDAFMNKNKLDKIDKYSKKSVVDKTHHVQNMDKSIIFGEPTNKKNTTYQVEKHVIQQDTNAMSIIAGEKGQSNKSADGVIEKEANINVITKISEEMLDNTSCITLVDDSMDVNAAEVVEHKLNIEATGEGVTKFTNNQTQEIIKNEVIKQNETESKATNSLSVPETCETQSRKRSLSPSKQQLNVTPKPPRKIHKRSNSPISDDRELVCQPVVEKKDITLEPEYICQKGDMFKPAISQEDKTNSKTICSVLENEKGEQEVIIDSTDKMGNFNPFVESKRVCSLVKIHDNINEKIPSQINLGEQEHNKITSEIDLAQLENNEITSEIAHGKQDHNKMDCTQLEDNKNTSKIDHAQLEDNKMTSESDLAKLENNKYTSEIDLSQLENNKITPEIAHGKQDHNKVTSDIDIAQKKHNRISSQMEVGKTGLKIASQSDLNETMDISMQDEAPKEKKKRDSLYLIEEFKNQVVTDIDKLPFMGTWCCQWQQICDSDWTFLFLHARLRLRVKLTETEHTCVHPDTKVQAVEVEEVDIENSEICTHATSACCSSLRALIETHKCVRAADVSALLTRCARVTARAAEWARDMTRAKAHLAFKLGGNVLTLQVANVPLRSVWQISLRVLDEGGGPRASDVRVDTICSDVEIARTDVEAVVDGVEQGWGNVSGTVWKLFKYLKHKTKGDNLLALLRS